MVIKSVSQDIVRHLTVLQWGTRGSHTVSQGLPHYHKYSVKSIISGSDLYFNSRCHFALKLWIRACQNKYCKNAGLLEWLSFSCHDFNITRLRRFNKMEIKSLNEV